MVHVDFLFFTNGASFVDILCLNMLVFVGIQKHLHSLFVWLRSMPAGDAFFFIPIPTPLLLFNGQNCHVLKRIPAPQSSSVISISGSSMGGGLSGAPHSWPLTLIRGCRLECQLINCSHVQSIPTLIILSDVYCTGAALKVSSHVVWIWG